MIKVHAIDTRGLVDKMGCTECKCDLYNVTKDENGEPLRPDYKGGMFCCYDQMQCRLREGFDGTKRSLYLRYTVESCSTDHKDGNGCLDVKRTSLPMKKGGYVIYGVAHQRSGWKGYMLFNTKIWKWKRSRK
ncbi:hypothetical protein GLYMA_05G126700v4 [Glycine max]|uniref:Uncharacterized protein n=1 Tax=Glycine max TaxID=3847 RepID=K7KPW1_SOYBN|nr:hypothetical protein GYH30_012466 [Glycine max]KRH58422.1 hypothetical protein GLYMA_05G126700v4 [Glycine max]